jgi:hypothetical protein
MHKNATKCNKTLSKWCKNKHLHLNLAAARRNFGEELLELHSTLTPQTSLPVPPHPPESPGMIDVSFLSLYALSSTVHPTSPPQHWSPAASHHHCRKFPRSPLRHHLCHLELNAVPYFAVVQDPQISMTVEFQSHQDLAVDFRGEPLLFLPSDRQI